MNPFADIHVHPEPAALPIDPDRIEVVTVRCPVRDRGLVVRELTRDCDPALLAFFAALAATGGEVEIDSDDAVVPALVELGFLVAVGDVVTPPQFAVPLPESGPDVGPSW